MFRIAKEFSFSAAHQLDYLPEDHKCHRLHGHNYIVTFVLQAEGLDDRGFAGVDYGQMSDIKGIIDSSLDHRNLNDIFMPVHTTAEHLAKWFFDLAQGLGYNVESVRVSETPRTYAEYSEFVRAGRLPEVGQ